MICEVKALKNQCTMSEYSYEIPRMVLQNASSTLRIAFVEKTITLCTEASFTLRPDVDMEPDELFCELCMLEGITKGLFRLLYHDVFVCSCPASPDLRSSRGLDCAGESGMVRAHTESLSELPESLNLNS